MKRLIAVALSGAMVTSCASAPDKISAAYVSPIQYGSYDCTQVREEMMRVASHVREVAGVQQQAHTRDQIAMGVGLVVFWPALFLLASGDKKAELADLKGQYEALNQSAIEKHCTAAGGSETVTERTTAPPTVAATLGVPAQPVQSAPMATASAASYAPAPQQSCRRGGLTSPTNPDALKPTGPGC